MEVASSRPDHLPTFSAAKTPELSLLVQLPFWWRSGRCRHCYSDFLLQCAGDIEADHTDSLPNRCWPLRGWKTRPTEEDGQIGTNHSLPLERGALFNRFFGKPAHGPPHVTGGASGPIGGCRDESRTVNLDLDLRHVFDRTLN